MAIKLKTKIALGGIFLFALLILVGGVNFYYLNRLSEESKAIVKANYETLNYSREMLNELDSLSKTANSLEQFETKLMLQENNITEPGEKEITASLRKNFNVLKEQGKNDSLLVLIRSFFRGLHIQYIPFTVIIRSKPRCFANNILCHFMI